MKKTNKMKKEKLTPIKLNSEVLKKVSESKKKTGVNIKHFIEQAILEKLKIIN